jgi:hypothetical protein
MRKFFFLNVMVVLTAFSFKASAQKDSLILSNKDVIVGDIKSMDRGVVTIETDYSKDDFRVEYSGISWIKTSSFFIITLADGTRLNGQLETADQGKIKIKTDAGVETVIGIADLVYIKSLDKGFKDRLNASVDFGFGLTKSQNLKQLSLRSNIGYVTESWSADVHYNSIYSNQDGVDPIRNTDAGLTFNYLLPKDWYIPVSLTLLSNTEQKIDLRTLGKLGVGNYIIHTNHSYWGVAGGITYNAENYADAEDRKSWEGYFGTELNLYDIGDLSLLTKLVAYPSFTESGRWRSDFNFDVKYDLPLDFYIKLGLTATYDNRPVEGASDTDYMMQTGFGWKW